jgi:transcriptional regulator with XRE-family HTH domain
MTPVHPNTPPPRPTRPAQRPSRLPGFDARLRELIGREPLSAFARKVGLSEALLRKYLAGSEPSLSRANQIARAANCSLEWLATGSGFRFERAELVDMGALDAAVRLALDVGGGADRSIRDASALKVVVALYQYLRATKRADERLDLTGAAGLARYVSQLCGFAPVGAPQPPHFNQPPSTHQGVLDAAAGEAAEPGAR